MQLSLPPLPNSYEAIMEQPAYFYLQQFQIAERMESAARVRKFRLAYQFYRGYQLLRQRQIEQNQELLTMEAYCDNLGGLILELVEKYLYILHLGQKLAFIVDHYRDQRLLALKELHKINISATPIRDLRRVFPIEQ